MTIAATDKEVSVRRCPECHGAITLTSHQWDKIRLQAHTATGAEVNGMAESECGHLFSWMARLEPDGTVYAELSPFVDSSEQERALFYRDNFPLVRAIQAQDVTTGPTRDAFLSVLEQYRGRFKTALDIGCSTGAVARLVRDDFGAHVTGVDFNRESVIAAKSRDGDGRYYCMDIADLPGPLIPGDFDLVYTVGVLMHTGPTLYRETCETILSLKPKIVIHQEIQGEERVIEFRTDSVYFMRSHDYIGAYTEMGVPSENIVHREDKMTIGSQPRLWHKEENFIGLSSSGRNYLTVIVVEVE